jgi:hypothetical protein
VNTYAFEEGKEDVYIQDLSVKTDIGIIGQSFNAEAGRVAYKLSPYMFQRPKTEDYYDNERWADGKYRMDGAILGFNFGVAKLHIWGGNTSNLLSVNGVDLNPLVISNTRTAFTPTEGFLGTNGTLPATLAAYAKSGYAGTVDKTAAADLGFGLGSNGHLSLAYLVLEQEAHIQGLDDLVNSGEANRDSIAGGDADFGFGRLKIGGGFHESVLTDNFNTSVNSKNNQSWDATAKYSADKFNVYGGYRSVDKDYFAPGDWGRLGIIQNPGNIHGWQGGGTLDLSKAIRITAEGEWDKGYGSTGDSDSSAGLATSPFQSNTNIRQLTARLDLRINPNFSLYGSFQDVTFDHLVGGAAGGTAFLGDTSPNAGLMSNAQIDWTTIGLGYGLSPTAKFSLAYQFSNGDTSGNNVGGAKVNGGILTSQLTIKF